jgi:chemotaxis regulatin CheY-phosphate phosphatase CheZ
MTRAPESTAVTRAPAALSELDYDTILAAVEETARGRWFLAEYARRNRHLDTLGVTEMLARIEAKLANGPAPVVQPVKVDVLGIALDMAEAIARTKTEIAAIRIDDDQGGRIGEATGELDAIVTTTETATSDILAAAEQIQEIAWTLREQGFDDAVCDLIDAKATDIYQACSFQDLTGQRTRKVIQVLRYLEERVAAMVDIWDVQEADAPKSSQTKRQGDRALLNGPALPGQRLDQGDVDTVMALAANRPPQQTMTVVEPERVDVVWVETPDFDPPVVPEATAFEPEPVPEPRPVDVLLGQDMPLGQDMLPGQDISSGADIPLSPEPTGPVASPRVMESPRLDALAPIARLSADEKAAFFS